MSEAIFTRSDGLYVPTEHARGPWDPAALHGGAPAALIANAVERFEPGSELPVARLTYEFRRPVPAGPLALSLRLVRPGRRVQELEAELRHEDTVVCAARALRVAPAATVAVRRAEAEQPPDPPLADPEQGRPITFALDDIEGPSFAATGMQMRWLHGDRSPGPATVWMRLRHPIVAGETNTPLTRLAASADFGNGLSAVLPWSEFLFINADLTVYLHRMPEGEWIGLDARTQLSEGGAGVAESVLYDRGGRVGRALQALVVQAR